MEIYERKSIQWYICKSAKQEGRGGECSPPLILYMETEDEPEEKIGEL